MTEPRPEKELVRENTVAAMMRYLNYTRAGQKLGVSARTIKNRVQSYGYSLDDFRKMKSDRARQRIMKFVGNDFHLSR